MTRRIGIYPGTFDPVHQGHLSFCLEAIKQVGLDEVVFVPESQPRGKPGATEVSRRLQLLTEATAAFPFLNVVNLSHDRFTVSQTLPELQARFDSADLSLLIGSDIVSTLDYWDNVAVLLHGMPLIIGMRQPDTIQAVETALRQIEQTHAVIVRHSLIKTPHDHVASSHIRSGKMTADLHIVR